MGLEQMWAYIRVPSAIVDSGEEMEDGNVKDGGGRAGGSPLMADWGAHAVDGGVRCGRGCSELHGSWGLAGAWGDPTFTLSLRQAVM